VHVANSTRHPYRPQRYTNLNGFRVRRLILTTYLHPRPYNMRCWISYQFSSSMSFTMFECYSTLSNIISLLIHPAAFVSSMLYHVLSQKSSENIISINRIRAQISTVSRRLQNTLRICVRNVTFRCPHFYLSDLRYHRFVL